VLLRMMAEVNRVAGPESASVSDIGLKPPPWHFNLAGEPRLGLAGAVNRQPTPLEEDDITLVTGPGCHCDGVAHAKGHLSLGWQPAAGGRRSRASWCVERVIGSSPPPN